MAEYLAPGVYIEETSYRSKSIEGVSTSTAGFVGPTRFGPVDGEPELVTSLAEFERIYGGLEQLQYEEPMHNYVAHAVRSFFEEGGRRLYVARVFKAGKNAGDTGHATAQIKNEETSSSKPLNVSARHPGRAGNGTVTFQFRLGPNILGQEAVDPMDPAGASIPVLRGARNYDVVLLSRTTEEDDEEKTEENIYWLERYLEEETGRYTFRLWSADPDQDPEDEGEGEDALTVSQLNATGDEVRVLTVDVTFTPIEGGYEQTWSDLTFHPAHSQSLTRQFTAEPTMRSTELYVPLVVKTESDNGAAVANVLLAQPSFVDDKKTVGELLADERVGDAARSFRILLKGGNDGQRPKATEYEGDEGETKDGRKSGLKALEDLDDISMVAAPGSTFLSSTDRKDADAITRLLISHAERMRYRIAVLDVLSGQTPSEIKAYRGQLDSTHAALYYPWIRILDPVTREEINVPPSGFVTGIYARSDVEYGVHKAPANEVVRSALGLENVINQGQQDVLNPVGINCFRSFTGRGIRLWGARTISSDPEWKYVNLRRYFAYLERSIETNTQWIVFMNNTPALWEKVRRTVEDFLYNEWRSQRLMGTKPAEAFFVRCDRSTMTQNDLDNGRLICLVGVAAVRPAEFVIFRIGQWTADQKV